MFVRRRGGLGGARQGRRARSYAELYGRNRGRRIAPPSTFRRHNAHFVGASLSVKRERGAGAPLSQSVVRLGLRLVERGVHLGDLLGLDRAAGLAVGVTVAAVRRLAAEVDPERGEVEVAAVGADLLER